MPKPKQKDGYRLLPWADWGEWLEVKDMVDAGRTNDAMQKVTAFMLRRSTAVPIAMLSTVSLMYQLENPSPDPYTHRLALSMAITRLVNGTTDQFQPRGDRAMARSVASVAAELGMPLELVEIRHQACHNELPSLSCLKYASRDALAWLKDWYWEPQMKNVWPYVKNSTYVLAKIFNGEMSQTERQLMSSDLNDQFSSESLSVNMKDSDAILDNMNRLSAKLDESIRKTAAEQQRPLVSRNVKDWGSTTFGLLPGQRWAPRTSLLPVKRLRALAGVKTNEDDPSDVSDSDGNEEICTVSKEERPQDEMNEDGDNRVKRRKCLSTEEEMYFHKKVAEFQLLANKIRDIDQHSRNS